MTACARTRGRRRFIRPGLGANGCRRDALHHHRGRATNFSGSICVPKLKSSDALCTMTAGSQSCAGTRPRGIPRVIPEFRHRHRGIIRTPRKVVQHAEVTHRVDGFVRHSKGTAGGGRRNALVERPGLVSDTAAGARYR